ncbi:MAG: DUF6134 family protein [Kiloniellales bacterium]|nr:DUF6134 family protein [Kiloniellales bacterium]
MSQKLQIPRRDLLAMLAAGAALAPSSGLGAALASDDRIAFDVLREDSSIGRHVISFRREGGDLLVDVDIALQVDFAFLTLYRYSNRTRERWRDGRLISLNSQTDDDGTPHWVRAEATADGLRVDNSEGTFTAPADTIPTSYWNPRTVEQRQLLDSQHGRLLSIEVRPQGEDDLLLPLGLKSARQYRMAGDLELDLWYGPRGEWLKMAFEAKGAEIEYTPVETANPSRL